MATVSQKVDAIFGASVELCARRFAPYHIVAAAAGVTLDELKGEMHRL